MLRKLAYVLAALLAVAGAAAGLVFARMKAKMRGPPPPACQLAPLQRKAFAAPRQLSFPGRGAYHIEPSAALTREGDLAAIYNARTSLFGDSWLEVVKRSASGQVSTVELRGDKSQYFDAWLANGGDGVLRAVWLGHNGGRPERDMEVGYAESADGATWSAPRPVHDAERDCPPGEARGCMDKPMIAAAGGRILVFYYSGPGGGLKMRPSLDGARTFQPSVAAGDGAYADLAVAPSGAVHVVSMTADDGDGEIDLYGDARSRIEHRVSAGEGRPFSKANVVNAVGDVVPFFFSNPQVEADEARGLLYVVYPAGPAQRWDLWLATSRDGGQSWSRVKVNDDPSCANHMAPQAALDPKTGTLHVTWLENRSGKGGLAYAACASGGAACSENEAVSEPFASYSFERHSPGWLAEYGTLLLDEERGVLHSVWTQTVDEDGAPTARIFHAQARLAR